MRARRLTPLLPLPWLLLACEGTPGPAAPAPAGPRDEQEPRDEKEDEEPAAADAAREARLQALLPLGADRVSWYRSSEPGRPPRRVAMYLRRDPQRGAWWQSLGPGAGPGGLCLWRSRWAVWVLPGSFSRPGAFRAWTGAPSWDEGQGREAGQEELETPAGRFLCLRTEFGQAGSLERVWLAEGVGLVALERRRRGAPVRRLELEQVAPRGGGAAYAQGSPDELWASVTEALLRLDPDGVERLLGPELLRRARRPLASEGAGEGPLLGPRPRGGEEPDPDALRIEALLGELVALAPARTGPWRVEAGQARAAGELLRGRARVPCELVLQAGPDGWRWEDLIVPAE